MQTCCHDLVGRSFCIVLGIPIGIVMARSDRVRATIIPILDVMQTMPSFVYLIPVVMLLGIGKVPGAHRGGYLRYSTDDPPDQSRHPAGG